MKTLISQGVQHTIYEPHETDMVPNKSIIKNAYTGCYVQSEEGYWVPVIKHNNSKHTTYLRLPKKQITNRTNKFSYIPERMNVDKYYLNPKQKAVAELMLSGVPFPKAVRSVYVNYKKGVRAIIHCENFFIYMGKTIMTLKDRLIEKGMDENFLADQIKDIITSEKRQSPIIKLWALNKLADSLVEKDTSVETKQLERAREQKVFMLQIQEQSVTSPPMEISAVSVSPEDSSPSSVLDYDITDLLNS